MAALEILIIVTSHEQAGSSGQKTGIWLEELAVPYYFFKEAGAVITLASVQGGAVPVDPKSESIIASNSTIKRFQKDNAAMGMVLKSTQVSLQKAGDFDLVLVLGGHGAIWDFYSDVHLKKLLEDFNGQYKPIGAIGQGVTAFLQMVDRSGNPFVKGRLLTACSNSEEKAYRLTVAVPFQLETELISFGASYSKKANFENHTVTDQNIVTGQNAASAKEVAEKLLICRKNYPAKYIVSSEMHS
jgi:putative intracellular protease/amidase